MSLVIFQVEMELPDGKPAQFDCSWVPSSLIDIVARTNPDEPSSARDRMYAQGYFSGWHNLEVPAYPSNLESGAGFWSSDPLQDFQLFLLHFSYD